MINIKIAGFTGDNHALQGFMSHNMAGGHTCVFADHPKQDGGTS